MSTTTAWWRKLALVPKAVLASTPAWAEIRTRGTRTVDKIIPTSIWDALLEPTPKLDYTNYCEDMSFERKSITMQDKKHRKRKIHLLATWGSCTVDPRVTCQTGRATVDSITAELDIRALCRYLSSKQHSDCRTSTPPPCGWGQLQ